MRGATVLRTKPWAGRLVRNHAKFVAVDHQFLVVSSANSSMSAEVHNIELGLVIVDPLVTQAVERPMGSFETQVYEVVRREWLATLGPPASLGQTHTSGRPR